MFGRQAQTGAGFFLAIQVAGRASEDQQIFVMVVSGTAMANASQWTAAGFSTCFPDGSPATGLVGAENQQNRQEPDKETTEDHHEGESGSQYRGGQQDKGGHNYEGQQSG